MALKNDSLRSKQRLRILDAYRGRGRRNNNLHLVYSIKTNRDWVLPSDRQFIHWIHFLEVAPNVKSFDLAPDLIISHDGTETRGTELDAVVTLRNGSVEWHEVKSNISELITARSQLLAQAAASSKVATKYRIFTDNELKPVVKNSMRWLKAISYAAALRDSPLPHETTALISYLREKQRGTLLDVFLNFKTEINDVGVLIGLLSRLSIMGFISLDFSNFGLSVSTSWSLVGEK